MNRSLLKYKGRCASCGSGQNSERMRRYSAGYLVPENFSLPLEHRSPRNCRICKYCYDKHFGRAGEVPVRKKLKFSVARPVIPRKKKDSVTSQVLMEAFEGRSQAAQVHAVEMANKWNDSNQHTWENEAVLRMLQNTRCTRKSVVFGREKECLGVMEFRDLGSKGPVRFVEMRCMNCGHGVRYSSQSSDGKVTLDIDGEEVCFRKDDVRDMLLVLLSGSTYTSYSMLKSPELSPMAESTFYRIQQALCAGVVRVCQDILREERSSLLQELVSRDGKWVAQLNGAWSHRGWTARHHTFLVRAKDQNKVVSAVVRTKKHVSYVRNAGGAMAEKVVHDGNYIGTSKGMEGEAFILALQDLRESDLLTRMSHVVCDGDSGIPKILVNTPGCEHLKIAGDPGHMQRNFFRTLQDIFGMSLRYRGYPYRIGKFFMQCLKTAEMKFDGHSDEAVSARKACFDEMWQHAYDHYTRKECPKACPCNEFYRDEGEEVRADDIYTAHALSSLLNVESHAGEADGEMLVEVEEAVSVGDEVVREILDGEDAGGPGKVKARRAPKKWLDVANDAKDEELAKKIKPVLKLAGDNVSEVLFGLNTCLSECSNIRRLVFCRKDRFYYQSYEVRSLISAVQENVGRNYLWQRIYAYFAIPWDEKDERVDQMLERKDEKREKHSARKRSREYINRQAEIAKSRIEENLIAQAESKKRSSSRGYTKLGNKRLKAGVFERKRGPMSQEELKAAKDRGENVHQCDRCKKYYRKTHNRCNPKAQAVKGKRQQRGRKRTAIVQERPRPAPPPSPLRRPLEEDDDDGAASSALEDSSSIADRLQPRAVRRRIDVDVDWDDEDQPDGSSFFLESDEDD